MQCNRCTVSEVVIALLESRSHAIFIMSMILDPEQESMA